MVLPDLTGSLSSSQTIPSTQNMGESSVETVSLPDNHPIHLIDEARKFYRSKMPPFIQRKDPITRKTVVLAEKTGHKPQDQEHNLAIMIAHPWDKSHLFWTLDCGNKRYIVKTYSGGAYGGAYYRKWEGPFEDFSDLPIAFSLNRPRHRQSASFTELEEALGTTSESEDDDDEDEIRGFDRTYRFQTTRMSTGGGTVPKSTIESFLHHGSAYGGHAENEKKGPSTTSKERTVDDGRPANFDSDHKNSPTRPNGKRRRVQSMYAAERNDVDLEKVLRADGLYETSARSTREARLPKRYASPHGSQSNTRTDSKTMQSKQKVSFYSTQFPGLSPGSSKRIQIQPTTTSSNEGRFVRNVSHLYSASPPVERGQVAGQNARIQTSVADEDPEAAMGTHVADEEMSGLGHISGSPSSGGPTAGQTAQASVTRQYSAPTDKPNEQHREIETPEIENPLTLYKRKNTNLRISKSSDPNYTLIKMRSCATMAKFLDEVLLACDLEGQEEKVESVAVNCTWLTENASMYIKRRLPDTFDTLLETINEAPCWANEGGKCTVAVRVILK